MAKRTAVAEDPEDVEVTDEELADWGLDGIGEDDDEDDEATDSPEAGEGDGPADGDGDEPDPDAPADADALLPGDDAQQPDPTPDETPELSPSADPADRTAADAPAADPEVRPWAFKADGKEVTVPRSQVFRAKNPDGTEEEFVLFPMAEMGRTLHNHLADRGAWRNEKKALLEKVAELDPTRHEEVVKARELTTFIFGLLDKSEDEILAAVEKLRADRPAWEARQEAAALRSKLEARDQVKIDPDPELQRIRSEETQTQLRASLSVHVGELLKRPEFAGVDGDAVLSDLWDLRTQVYFIADEDMPQFGLRKGDIGINLDYVAGRLQREAGRIQQIRERTNRAREIERQNAEVLGTPKAKPAINGARRPRPKKADEEEEFDMVAFLNDTEL